MPSIRRRKAAPETPVEMDMGVGFEDTRRKSRKIILAGVIMAIAAGAASFVLLSRAQQQAASNQAPHVAVVVAARTIPARKPIERDDLVVRQVPIDPTNAQGIFDDPSKLIDRVPGVTILQGQLVTSNLFTFSNATTGQLAILSPEEKVTADSPAWRAVSLNVPDDRAVGGLLQSGALVDVFVTASVIVPQNVLTQGKFYNDKTTKVTYQNVPILAKAGTMYVIKVTEEVGEEIAHMQASGTAQFSMALRPDVDTRVVDASGLGETTNLIIQRYGLPVPQVFPQDGQQIPTGPVAGSPTPAPPVVQAVASSPAPSAP
jgi:Flp pilus assembly protein CpaB